MLAVIASPRGSAIIHPDEATLSRELRTVGLLRPHVSVGYRRQNARLRHLLTSACNKYRHDFVSQPASEPCVRLSPHTAPRSGVLSALLAGLGCPSAGLFTATGAVSNFCHRTPVFNGLVA